WSSRPITGAEDVRKAAMEIAATL
ncbi:MAG: hypothetical protein RLZZ330_1032, partial [Actinomycetota bacterium]